MDQAEFAKRLRRAMKATGLGGIDLAERGVAAAGTVSRWRRETYPSGPPGETDQRRLEVALGLPRGAFQFPPDEWEAALNALNRRRDTATEPQGEQGRLGRLQQLVREIKQRADEATYLLELPPPSRYMESEDASTHVRAGKKPKLRRANGA